METPNQPELKQALLKAALPHVPFDGWSPATFEAAARDANIELALARALCPRGAVDLALMQHQAGDDAMATRLEGEDLSALRFREKVAHAVRARIEAAGDREVVRRATTLFALPQNAAAGAKAIWGTADRIWQVLGDTSTDGNWYSKRATLSGVYGATLLYWLGDDSTDNTATWAFLDRRIDDVMQVEKVKEGLNGNPLTRPLMAGPNWLMSRLRPPQSAPGAGLPGFWARRVGPRPQRPESPVEKVE